MNNILHPKYEPSICPRCGNKFTCTLSANCWCMEYDLPKELIEILEQLFEECICKCCIEELLKEYKT